MFKKFNWGTGIFIFILIFLGTVFYRIYISSQQDLNLVSKDYYPKGINHQAQMQKVKNTIALTTPFRIESVTDSIVVLFPAEIMPIEKGSIHFFRPSDSKSDRIFQLGNTNQTRHSFAVSDLSKGRYTLKIDVRGGTKDYFYEQNITF